MQTLYISPSLHPSFPPFLLPFLSSIWFLRVIIPLPSLLSLHNFSKPCFPDRASCCGSPALQQPQELLRARCSPSGSPALSSPMSFTEDGAVSESSPYLSAQPSTWASWVPGKQTCRGWLRCSLQNERGQKKNSASCVL